MDLLKLNIFRGGVFKQAKFLVSTPQSAQKVVLISEAGTISQEILPMHTGWISTDIKMGLKKAWLVLHSCKFSVYKDGVPVQDEQVLLISERSYIPLDPNELIKQKEKEKLTSLKDIARLRHTERRIDAGRYTGGQGMAEKIVYGCFILLGLMLLTNLIQCGGT